MQVIVCPLTNIGDRSQLARPELPILSTITLPFCSQQSIPHFASFVCLDTILTTTSSILLPQLHVHQSLASLIVTQPSRFHRVKCDCGKGDFWKSGGFGPKRQGTSFGIWLM